MSVLIKGMEMPHSCMGCRFCAQGSIDEWELYCAIDYKRIGNWDDKHINNGWRHPDCPLVEVHVPHGRLIDAEKLERDIEEYHLSDGKFQHWVQVQNSIIEAEEGEARCQY